MKIASTITCLLVVASPATAVAQQDHIVDPNGGGYTNIMDAAANAANGDRILVRGDCLLASKGSTNGALRAGVTLRSDPVGQKFKVGMYTESQDFPIDFTIQAFAPVVIRDLEFETIGHDQAIQGRLDISAPLVVIENVEIRGNGLMSFYGQRAEPTVIINGGVAILRDFELDASMRGASGPIRGPWPLGQPSGAVIGSSRAIIERSTFIAPQADSLSVTGSWGGSVISEGGTALLCTSLDLYMRDVLLEDGDGATGFIDGTPSRFTNGGYSRWPSTAVVHRVTWNHSVHGDGTPSAAQPVEYLGANVEDLLSVTGGQTGGAVTIDVVSNPTSPDRALGFVAGLGALWLPSPLGTLVPNVDVGVAANSAGDVSVSWGIATDPALFGTTLYVQTVLAPRAGGAPFLGEVSALAVYR